MRFYHQGRIIHKNRRSFTLSYHRQVNINPALNNPYDLVGGEAMDAEVREDVEGRTVHGLQALVAQHERGGLAGQQLENVLDKCNEAFTK